MKLAPIARGYAFEVRRDAATELPGGRVRMTALTQRAGLQSYEDGDEYRPPEEVFSRSSLISNATAPVVLLHPPKNYAGSFGPGAHPVRGCTCENFRAHSDGIHVIGDLVVWDSDLLDLAMSREVVQLSNGYSINPDPTPGIVPAGLPGAGKPYKLVHRDIVVDHVAFVPEGNAGTARVILDTQQIAPVSRRALADIAAGRMDSRPYYHDLGAWQVRRSKATEKDHTMTRETLDKLAKLAREILDAKITIEGDDTDPNLLAALEGLAAVLPAPAPAEPMAEPEATPESEPVADEDPDVEGQAAPAATAPAATATAAPAPTAAPVAKADAARVHERAKAIAFGMDALGHEWAERLDAGSDTSAIKLEILRAVEPNKAERLDKMDAAERPGALAFAFDEVKAVHRERKDWAAKTIEAINAARAGREDTTTEIQGPITVMTRAAARK